MKVPYTIKFADVSKSFYILNYLANSVCKFPTGPTIFLPTNQAWSDALEGYKKSRSSGALYEALDAVASDRIKNAIVWAGSKTMINSTELSRLADKAKSCKTLTTHPIGEAARTALYNLMSFHTAASRVTILNLDSQCTATGTSFKTAFNSNNLNFKCNSTDTGFISGSDPLASGATAGTPSAVAMIDEPQKDYFYVNAVVFPSNISSLPGAVASVSRLFTALLVFASALAWWSGACRLCSLPAVLAASCARSQLCSLPAVLAASCIRDRRRAPHLHLRPLPRRLSPRHLRVERHVPPLVSEIGNEPPISSCALSPDASLVATSGWSGACRLWSQPAVRAAGALRGHSERATCVARHPHALSSLPASGPNLVTAGADRYDRCRNGG
ncbi:unnamed protein product [Closterium sp. NIES-64]|nr:unnamed protein product [Closterium sp. NIES-64]